MLCDEAVACKTAMVMVPSCYVAGIVEEYGNKLRGATVVGFSNGNASLEAKIAETAGALADGAVEIDMVINIGAFQGGDVDFVTDEIRALKRLCGERVRKVIVETCFLTEEEKIAACGAKVAKMSGRGLGHTGGTVDKFRSHSKLSNDP